MACCDNWIKIRLLLTNFLIAGSGIAFIITVYSLYEQTTYFYKLLDDGIIFPPIILFVIGWALLILSFFGCCGVVMQSSSVLKKYAILLIVTFLLQITTGCVSLFRDRKTDEDYYNILNEEYALASDNSSIKMIHMLQIEVQCCGVNGPFDFFTRGNLNWSSDLLFTCCKNCNQTNYPCHHVNITTCNPHTTGCSEGLYSFLSKREDYIGKLSILFAFVDLAGIIQALIMAKNMKTLYKAIVAFGKGEHLNEI